MLRHSYLRVGEDIEIRDRTTSQNINKMLRKTNTTPKGPLKGNGMDAISKRSTEMYFFEEKKVLYLGVGKRSMWALVAMTKLH